MNRITNFLNVNDGDSSNPAMATMPPRSLRPLVERLDVARKLYFRTFPTPESTASDAEADVATVALASAEVELTDALQARGLEGVEHGGRLFYPTYDENGGLTVAVIETFRIASA